MEPTVTIKNSQTGEVRQVPQSQLASYGVQPPQPQVQQPQAPQSSGGFSSYLPLLGAIGGSFVGNPILGGAIGAGLGTLGKQAIQGKANPGEVIGESALAGAGGVGGELLSGLLGHFLPGLLSKAGEGAIASQYNVPRNVARAINFPQSIKDLAQYGLTDMGKIPQAAEAVTGSDGIISKLTRSAVAKANPVQLGALSDTVTQPAGLSLGKAFTTESGLSGPLQEIVNAGSTNTVPTSPSVLEMAHELATNPSMTEGTTTKFINFIDKGLQNTMGGTEGNVTGTAKPSEVFNFIQQLEKQAAGITRGRAPTAITAEDKTLANAYNSIADELRHRLFNVAGGNDAVAGGLLTPDQFKTLQGIHPQLAQDVANAKTVGELRGIAAPFVQGNQAAAETNAASQFGFQNLAGQAKGLGQAVPSLANPLAPVSLALSQPGVNAKIGGAALKGAEALKSLPLSPEILQRAGVATGAGLGTQTPTAQAAEPQTAQQNLAAPENQTTQGQDLLRQKLGAYIISRAKNANDLIQGYDLLYPKPVQGQLTPQERNSITNQLNQFANTYKQMGPLQRLNPYDPQNRQLQTIRTTMLAQMRKAIVGGRATQQELGWFMNLLPPLNHPSAIIYPNQTVDSAIDQLKTSFNLATPQNQMPLPGGYSNLGQ